LLDFDLAGLFAAVFALPELLLRAGVFFELVLVAAGFLLGAAFFVDFDFESLFLLFVLVLLFAAGFFLDLAGLFVVFFVWEDFFEVVAITGKIIQKKGNVVKGVAFGS
jgi:hypothetical protein